MQNPVYGAPAQDFRSSYQRYKALSNAFTSWLVSTYDGLNSSNRSSHHTTKIGGSKAMHGYSKPTVSDLEQFAEFIVKCPRHGLDKVPRSILNCLYKIIQRRSEAHMYYSHRLDSDVSSNRTHAHFIGVLERMFDTLGGEAWIRDHLTSRSKRSQNAELPTNPACDNTPAPNRFFAFSPHSEDQESLSDDDDELIQEYTWSPEQSSSSDSKPGKSRSRRSSAASRQSRKRFKSNFPDIPLGEDDSEEMFTQFCFFDDLNMLRKHVRCIWSEWTAEPTLKGLIVAATATDVAVRVAEDLETRFLGHDPTLTGLDAESARQALVCFDGMVRASEDWTIGLMNPYYAAMSDTTTKAGANIVTGSSTIAQASFATSHPSAVSDVHGEVVLALKYPIDSHEYWAAFMSRMAGELAAVPDHSVLNAGESSLNQLIRSSSSVSDSRYLPEDDSLRPRLHAVTEIVDDPEAEEIISPEQHIEEQQSVVIRQTASPKPCLIFAAQVYLDIDQITLGVDFPYHQAVTHLGKKIYTYMNWLSCQSLKRHIKTLTLTPSMEILPIMDEMPPLGERRPYASMSLAPQGVWQDGMGDFGRLVGLKISRDVGAEINRGTIAIINPNRDAILSPWSWGSRAMHILAESLRFGAKAYNEGGMFIVVAHIYNALRETRPPIPTWRHMDSFLAIHGKDIFNGSRPTGPQAEINGPEFFYNRWRLRMGLPAREFSKGKRAGQFTKRERNVSSRSNYGTHGCQVADPDTCGPALTLRRPKPSANRNSDGISKEVLAVRLVEKRMHLDAESLRLLTGSSSRNHGVDLGYLVTATKERLDEDMAKMSQNLFAMEAYCQRVIERVISSVPREILDGFLESCGLVTDSSGNNRWEIRENLPVFAALVLLLLDTYHPLKLAWVQAFEAIAEEDEDAGFVLLHEEAVLVSAQPGHVEEVVE